MPTPPLSRELAEQAVAALDAAMGNKTNAAKALGVPRQTFNSRLAAAARYGLLGPVKAREGFSIVQITERMPDGTSVVTKPEFDEPSAPEGMTEKGRSVYVPGKGWFKYGKDQSDEALADAVRAAFKGYTHKPVAAPTTTDANTLAVYPLPDLHVGLLAWEEETGSNYDTHIARDEMRAALRNLIAATPPSRHALILGLGDLLHFDGYEPKTERSGNVLDTDSRYPKVLREAVGLVRFAIEHALTKHETVEVRLLAGNHDTRAALAVALALSLGYENEPRVTIDDSPSYLWFKRYGKVMLGATHGDKTKMDQMPLLMAVDRPEDWAASTRRRVFTGHIHHERLKEIGGVIVESLRSPVAKDAYHSFAGYRAGRSVYSYTFWLDGSRMAKMEFEL